MQRNGKATPKKRKGPDFSGGLVRSPALSLRCFRFFVTLAYAREGTYGLVYERIALLVVSYSAFGADAVRVSLDFQRCQLIAFDNFFSCGVLFDAGDTIFHGR